MLELINPARADGGVEAARLQGWTNKGSPVFSGGLQEGPPSINGQGFAIGNTAQPLSWNALLLNCAQRRAEFLNDNDQFSRAWSPHLIGAAIREVEIRATNVAPSNDQESAIVATLSGNGTPYTAIVRGANNSTGIAVVEVFALN
jgi:hypothetical protein